MSDRLAFVLRAFMLGASAVVACVVLLLPLQARAQGAGEWQGPVALGELFDAWGGGNFVTLCLGADTAPPLCQGATISVPNESQVACTFEAFGISPETPPFFGNTGSCWFFAEAPPLVNWADTGQVLQALFWLGLAGLAFYGYGVGARDA